MRSTATIDIDVIDDSILEDNETVIVTLGTIVSGDADAAISSTNKTANITLTDDDSALASITAADDTAAEPDNDGKFTVSLIQRQRQGHRR